MDNDSSDGTAAIARELGATVHSRPFRGYGDALRQGMEAATGDILVLVVQSLILLLLAIPFGLQATFSGVLVMLGLVALIGLGMSSICYAAALALRSEDSYAPLIFTISLPLLLLSGVLLPLTLAPQWLQNIAAANPLSYAVTAARDMFNGNAGSPDVVKGLVIMVALCVVGVFIGARSFNRAVA